MHNLIKFIIISGLCLPVYAQTVSTIFGNVEENNPVILSLMECNAMERLKHIDQSGPQPYFSSGYPSFSRYDHSLGVYALLKKFGVSEKEQIAGLLHDASHTVFSHIGDMVFHNGNKRTASYQDSIHEWYLAQMGVDGILQMHKLGIKDVLPDNHEFTALEQDYPDMSADRIEYNLHTGIVLNDLTYEDVQDILAALRFDDNKWYFIDPLPAKRFARLSTYYNKSFWGSHSNSALYAITAAAIKRAFALGVINRDDFHFGVDQDVVNKLSLAEDKQLIELVEIMSNFENYYRPADPTDYDLYIPVKMRGIDPLVLHDNDLVRLSQLSYDYNNELINTRRYCKEGIYIKFVNINNKEVLTSIKDLNF